jgi:hypothetical protein
MGDDPIVRREHVARDLRLDGIDVVHQRGRREDAAEKNGGCKKKNDQAWTRADSGTTSRSSGSGAV